MCGLVAVISKSKFGMSIKDLDVFETMLFLDTLRGDDSTGVFLVDNIGNVMIAKEASDGPAFLKSKEWSTIRSAAIQRGFALVGHNRKATRGSITDENAHPFWVEDKIVLVHNGSILGGHKHLADTEVDSHAIAHTIANEATVEAALQKINAAYALMWYNVPEKSFNIIRNSQRPLHFNQNTQSWYFTSEETILDFCLDRCNVLGLNKDSNSLVENHLQTWVLKEDKSFELTSSKIDNTFRSQHQITHINYWPGAQRQGPWWDGDACGYEGAFQEATQTPATKIKPEIPALMKRYLDNHAQQEFEVDMTYARYTNLCDYSLQIGNRIRVVVTDFDFNLEDPEGPCVVVAQHVITTSNTPIKVLFPLSADDLGVILQAQSDVVFYVSVDNHAWTYKDGDVNTSLCRGYMSVWGKHPTQLVTVDSKEYVVQ